jgi:hypothetical protein
MVDEAARKQLQAFLSGFAEFVQASSKLRS